MNRSSRKGQSLVETSLILAAFMALLLGIVAIGQTIFVRQTFSARVQEAARWGSVHAYDPDAIRKLVLYGATTPVVGTTAFMGLAPSEVVVTAPGCPGTQCRISVAIPRQGIRSIEPFESGEASKDAVPLKL